MAAKKLSTTEDKNSTKSASDGKAKKLSKKVQTLVDEISKLSVMELSELVNTLQDKLGVSAAVPVVAPSTSAGQGAPAGGEAPAQGAQAGGAPNQTVVMTQSGDNKIAVIKAIREIDQNIGLKEAKDMTEKLPAEVLKDAKADDAKAATEKLKAAGASVELK